MKAKTEGIKGRDECWRERQRRHETKAKNAWNACTVSVSVCWVTIHILEGDDVISTLFFPLRYFTTLFWLCPPLFISVCLHLQLSLHRSRLLPTVARSICVFLSWPGFHGAHSLLFHSLFQRSCLFRQGSLVLAFWHVGMAGSCALRRWCFKREQHWWSPAPSKTISPGTLQPEAFSQPELRFCWPFSSCQRCEPWWICCRCGRDGRQSPLGSGHVGLRQRPGSGRGLSWWVLGCGGLPPYCEEAPWGGRRVCHEARGPWLGMVVGDLSVADAVWKELWEVVGVGLWEFPISSSTPGTQQDPSFSLPRTAPPSVVLPAPPKSYMGAHGCCEGLFPQE